MRKRGSNVVYENDFATVKIEFDPNNGSYGVSFSENLPFGNAMQELSKMSQYILKNPPIKKKEKPALDLSNMSALDLLQFMQLAEGNKLDSVIQSREVFSEDEVANMVDNLELNRQSEEVVATPLKFSGQMKTISTRDGGVITVPVELAEIKTEIVNPPERRFNPFDPNDEGKRIVRI